VAADGVAYLQAEAGGRRAELSERALVVGRDGQCDLVVDDATVSRVHARIRVDGPDVLVEDLNSRNGTFLNGRRVREPARLHDGDRIGLASGTVLVFHAPAAPPREDVPPEDDVTTRTTVLRSSQLDDVHVRPEAKLRAVVEIARSLAGTLELDDLSQRVLGTLFRIFPEADRGFVLLRDATTDRLTTSAARSREGASVEAQVSRTIVERVLRTGEGILSADAGDDARLDPSGSIVGLRIRSVVCAPLAARSGVVLGVLQLHAESGHARFGREDLEVLSAVAGMVALAVENVHMHEHVLARERLARELDLARDVQRGFLPPHLPRIRGYGFHASYVPAASVGGDYYGFVDLPDGRLVVAIGDVSGKGMPAALLMARLSSDVRSAALSTPDPVAAVEGVGRSLEEAAGEDRFVTLLYMILDPHEHLLTVVNAGHLPPLVRRHDGHVEELGEEEAGLPLNVLPGSIVPRRATTRLEPGTVVLAVTDGVTEAMDSYANVFGLERLRSLLARPEAGHGTPGLSILDAVRGFTGSETFADDATLVAFRREEP
jgi:serine phosphatase RsbU (regulator of sigma subunit)/pSer/pThr/pTyr-binding forkhead associated (FHA) protein